MSCDKTIAAGEENSSHDEGCNLRIWIGRFEDMDMDMNMNML
jgi:hypothetical protein